MKQDNFNKIVTSSTLLFTMAMIIWSFVSGRALDPALFLAMIPTTVIHSTHLISNKIPDKNGSNGHG